MSGSVWTSTYHTSWSGGDQQLHMNTIAPAYFQTMRIPLLNGRDFRWNETIDIGQKDNPQSGRRKADVPGP